MSSQTRKLAVIHARTDRDLLTLIHRELDRGFALVDVATARNSPLFLQAEKSAGTVNQLLPRICHLSDPEHARVESRLKELRALLEQMPAVRKMSFPASVAS